MARVKLDSITQRYGKTVAVAEVTFTVPDGEFWVMVGPSGCGKSTLLRTIAGLEPVVEGDLYIGDRRVNAIPARQRDVAMVFQTYALYPHMTVAENLAFGLKMRRVPASEQGPQVARVARALAIDHLLDRKPGQLSGGQQQRVALGRAIARRPQVFLLDEPLSNLDAQLRDDTRAELKQLHQQFAITTLYVTHDQVEAMTLADRIVLLEGGRVQQIGTPQDLYSRPANRTVAGFLGNPPMNLFTAECAALGPGPTVTHFQLQDQVFPVPAALAQAVALAPAQRVALGIRPEHLHLAPEDPHLGLRVQTVEPLGRETLVRGTVPNVAGGLPGQLVSAIVPPNWAIAPDQTLPLHLDLTALYLFDLGTGTTLYPPPAHCSP